MTQGFNKTIMILGLGGYEMIINQLDKHVVLFPINYIASVLLSDVCIKLVKNVVKLVCVGNLLKLSQPSLRSFLFLLFFLISSKSLET